MLKKTCIIIMTIFLTSVYSQEAAVSSDEARFVSEKGFVREARLVPKLLNYQGYLTNTLGSPIDDTLDMSFKIFDAATVGNELWSETQTNVPVERGVFSVLLGSGTPIPDTVFTTGTDRWLELTLEGPQTLSPRTRIAAAGYAYTSTYSDTAEYAKTAVPDTDWVIFADTMYSGISGNVGIGTTSPSEKLEVTGNVKVSGTGNGIIFPDATKQTTAITGGGETEIAPPGYTYTGIFFITDSIIPFWTTKTSMPTARYRLAAVAVNNKLYAIGGYNGSVLNTNEEYDPVANSWTTKTAMPTPRYALAAAAANGKIYAVGGYDGSYLNTNEEYDPVANSWTTKAAMPYANASLAATEANGKIYAIGGETQGIGLHEYNPIANSWAPKYLMYWHRYGLAAATVNGKIYAIGGWWAGSYKSYNEEYDPVANSWTTKAAMPTARAWLAAVALNGKIYAIGGDQYGVLDTNEVYDPVGNSWATKAVMPTAREALAGAAVYGKIYAIGGYDGTSYLNSNEEYYPGTTTSTLYVHRKD
jgi:hypothetical protein